MKKIYLKFHYLLKKEKLFKLLVLFPVLGISMFINPIGAQNHALNFDGSDGQGVHISPMIPYNPDLTVMGWVNISSNLSKVYSWGSPVLNGYLIIESDYTGRLRYYVAGGATIVSNTNIMGKWHHFAVTKDFEGNVKLYIDGVMENSGVDVKVIHPTTSSIGENLFNGVMQGQCNGTIDELSVWSKVLTPGEVAAFKSTSPTGSEPGILALYNFDNPTITPEGDNTSLITATVLEDVTGTYSGTLTGFSLDGSNGNWILGPDFISPNVIAKDITVELDVNGNANVIPSQVDNGSTDNVGIVSLSLDKSTFSCSDVGTNNVVLTAEDNFGNKASNTAIVTIQDITSPEVHCNDITVFLDETGTVSIDATELDGGSKDNCGIESITVDKSSFTCADLGDNLVTLTVTDINDNIASCTSKVTVLDVEAPVLEAPSNIIVDNDLGECGALVNYIAPGTPEQLILEPIADSYVRERSPDSNYGTSTNLNIDATYYGSDEFIYLKFDVSSIPLGATVTGATLQMESWGGYATGFDGNVYSLFVADDSWSETGITWSNAPHATTNLGHWWRWCNNRRSCNATNRNSDPLLAAQVARELAGDGTMSLRLHSPGYDTYYRSREYSTASQRPRLIVNYRLGDNCSFTVKQTAGLATGSVFPIGTTTNTFEAEDISGNVSSCSFDVIVLDETSPAVQCNSIDIYLDEKGEYFLTDSDIEALSVGTSDNCTSYSDLWIQARPVAFYCNDVGEAEVDVVVSDKAGNRSYCRTIINVIDTNSLSVNPVEDILVELESGVCETEINYPDIVSMNACADLLQTEGLGPDGIFPVGITVETWKTINSSGDSVLLSFNVVITSFNELPTLDSIADLNTDEDSPVVSVPISGISFGVDCTSQNLMITAEGKNPALISGIVVNYNSPDSIGSLDLSIVNGTIGSDTISVTVSDGEGATISKSFVVIVNPVNKMPTIAALADLEVEEDSETFTVALRGITFGNDLKSQNISLTATGVNKELVDTIVVHYSSPDSIGSLEISLLPDVFGEDTIKVMINDNSGGSISESFVLKVTPVNDAPYLLVPLPDGEVNASYPYTVPLSTLMGVVFDDIDDELLTFDVLPERTDELPTWAVIENNILTAIPMIADTGSYSFVVTATDAAGAMAADTFMLVVEGYPTGINDFDSNSFDVTMYPNPTNGVVNLKINSSEIMDSEVVVRSITGSEIFRKMYKASEQIRIDLSDQMSGIYLISLQQGDKSVVRKLILDKK